MRLFMATRKFLCYTSCVERWRLASGDSIIETLNIHIGSLGEQYSITLFGFIQRENVIRPLNIACLKTKISIFSCTKLKLLVILSSISRTFKLGWDYFPFVHISLPDEWFSLSLSPIFYELIFNHIFSQQNF